MTAELDGKPVEAMVYIMNEGHPLGLPSDYYLNVILEGYASAGFDAADLEASMAASAGGKKPSRCADCLSCSNSMSVPAETDGDADRLFGVVKREYVEEDGYCTDHN